MTLHQFNRQQLIAMLAWQAEMGADEALSDQSQASSLLASIADIISVTVPSPISKIDMTQSIEASDLAPITKMNLSSNITLEDKLKYVDSLSALSDALNHLDICPLKHTASNMCFADGNPGSNVMIIGEAPGRDEDRLGVPFAGAAGQLLDMMMASIGFDRSTLYLVNLLPWRPPGNRTPTDEETDMLLPYLFRHVQLANPKFILVLGGFPAKNLLNSSDGILKLRGFWHEIDYGDGILRPTLASLHPAYLLRSPAQKRLAFDDLLKLQQRVCKRLNVKVP